MSALDVVGKKALAEMIRLWRLDVIDPLHSDISAHALASNKVINDILSRGGLKSHVPYIGNATSKTPQWCAAAAIACWRAVGLDMTDAEAAVYAPSTYRLKAWAEYADWREPGRGVVLANRKRPPAPEDRRLLASLNPGNIASLIKPGDIVIIGPMQHVVLADRWDAARRVLCTYSGNGWGVGPNGGRAREGIAYAEYSFNGKHPPEWLARPGFGDLKAEAS